MTKSLKNDKREEGVYMFDHVKFKKLRENAGLTTYQLAEAVGVSQSMIAHMERGVKKPSMEVLARIADELGVTMDALRKKEA